LTQRKGYWSCGTWIEISGVAYLFGVDILRSPLLHAARPLLLVGVLERRESLTVEA
jgi:hypothetical protein